MNLIIYGFSRAKHSFMGIVQIHTTTGKIPVGLLSRGKGGFRLASTRRFRQPCLRIIAESIFLLLFFFYPSVLLPFLLSIQVSLL